MQGIKRLIEATGLVVLVVLSGVAGYAVELLSPYATTRTMTVLLLLSVIVPFVGAVTWVVRQMERWPRRL